VEQMGQGTRYALAVRLPSQVGLRIEDTYLRLAGATKPVMGYHVTLLGPFHLPDEGGPDSLAEVSDLCGRWPPFSVRVGGLGAFRARGDNVVYLRISEAGPILALHDELVRVTRGRVALQDEEQAGATAAPYIPHVTLGLGLSDAELKGFLLPGAAAEVDERFQVSSVWLARQTPHSPWEYVREYRLAASHREG